MGLQVTPAVPGGRRVVGWQCGDSGRCRLYEGKETAEFQRSLQRFFLCLNQLMKSPLEGPTLLSQVRWGQVLHGGLSSGVWWDGRCPSGGDTSCACAGVTPAVLYGDVPTHGASKRAATLRGDSLPPGTPTFAPGAKLPEAADHKALHCGRARDHGVGWGQQLRQMVSRPWLC